MTTLTKVFIVVLVVFAIAFSMLVLQYTAQTENYRKIAADWESRFTQEQTLRMASDNQNKVVVDHLEKVTKTLQEEKSTQGKAMDKIAGDLSAVQNELLAEKQKTLSLTGQVSQLTSMNNAGDAERKQLQSQLEAIRKDNAGLRTDNFKLVEDNQKLVLQKQLYEQEIRLLKEQNFSLGERLEQLRSRSQAASTGSEPAAATGGETKARPASDSESAPIIGQITDVRDGLAGISIGSAQGVKTGMEFIVYRNGQYLGKLRISKVLPEQAAGELIQKQGNIRNGDKVTDKFQF